MSDEVIPLARLTPLARRLLGTLPHDAEIAKLTPELKRFILTQWESLTDNHWIMFYQVLEAYKRLEGVKSSHRARGYDWADRKAIAAEYKADRLIDYRVELLQRLADGKFQRQADGSEKETIKGLRFVETATRHNWHMVDGERLPARSSIVYRPNFLVLLAIERKMLIKPLEYQKVILRDLPAVPDLPARVDLPAAPEKLRSAVRPLASNQRAKVIQPKKPNMVEKLIRRLGRT